MTGRHASGPALVLALVFFGGQGSVHSDRCRGAERPRMLGIPGIGWVCTKAGWRWQLR